MIKKREFPKSNYRALWYNGKTLRLTIDPSKAVSELEYPEFYDVKITDECDGGCPWCYMDSTIGGKEADTAVEKILKFFGGMDENQRPFQVAIGGGEPTRHRKFIAILEAFKELGIEPNYTTNGMWTDINRSRSTVSDREYDILEATRKLCGGVAVSCHPHLSAYWERAARLYGEWNVKLNFHHIISDAESVDRFIGIYREWNDVVDHFVLLPYSSSGRAEKRDIDWEYLVGSLPEDQSKLAFGANFYPYLVGGGHNIKVSLYQPEIMSKFLDLTTMKLYRSSFSMDDEITDGTLYDRIARV